uniref:Uncharacterized protein n=1 Tax=Anguilla anguilla TaxID=7936 RepID=A0A0E9W434_ANGAN
MQQSSCVRLTAEERYLWSSRVALWKMPAVSGIRWQLPFPLNSVRY